MQIFPFAISGTITEYRRIGSTYQLCEDDRSRACRPFSDLMTTLTYVPG